MLRGLFSAASGMIGLEQSMSATANNIANVNSAGFKRSNVQFQPFAEMMMQRLDGNSTEVIGAFSHGSVVPGSPVDYSPGAVLTTGNPLDLAILGEGFFQIITPDGDVRYTRGGQFTRNEAGQIITGDGSFLNGSGGPVTIPASVRTIEIKPDGTLYIDSVQLDQIKLVDFDDKSQLIPVGNTMYEALGAPSDVAEVIIQQGAYERSNVSIIEEMVNNIQGMRQYEALKTSITTQDQTLGKAMEVGRIQ